MATEQLQLTATRPGFFACFTGLSADSTLEPHGQAQDRDSNARQSERNATQPLPPISLLPVPPTL